MQGNEVFPGLPKTARGLKKRQRILDAARVVFTTKGFLDTRVIDITSEAGVSIGNFYQYFTGKDHVLRVMLESFVAELYESSRSGWVRGEPFQALLVATRGLFEVYIRNADLYRVLMQVVNLEPRYTSLWLDLRRPFVQRTQSLLQRTPEFTRTGLSCELAASALGNMANQCAYLWLVIGGGELSTAAGVDLDEAARTVTHLWYRSIFGTDPPELSEQEGPTA